MFLERYNDLCFKKGESPNAVAKKLNIASGTVSEWKNGRVPRNATLQKIAEYFETTADYLIGKTDDPSPKQKKPAFIDDELWNQIEKNPRALELLKMLLKMSPEQMDAIEKVIGREEKNRT